MLLLHRFHAPAVGLMCVVALACSLALIAPAAAADVTVGEAPAGILGSTLIDLNANAAGYLYVSDYTAPAILKVNAANGDYTRYVFPLGAGFLIQPGDAKPDSAGVLWWSDYSTAFGKLTPGALQAEYWDLASRGLNPGGFAFDASNRLWFTQPNNSQLLRFTPSDRSLCTFSVGGGGDYLVGQGNLLWLADRQTGRLLRFDASNNQLAAWTLPTGWQAPEGLALDADGRVWWADSGANLIGRLTPGTNRAVVVTLPSGSQPVMLSAGTEVMWYTDGGGYVGFVDPAEATGSVQTLTKSTSTVGPSNCSTLGLGTQQNSVTLQTGTIGFAPTIWKVATGQTGVTRYALPKAGSTPALPWGTALAQGRTWLVDQNRNVLARTPRLPQSPVLSIGLETGGNRLTWEEVTQDEGGETISVGSYQVWRGSQPFFRPWDAGVILATTTSGANVLDDALATPGSPVFYGVRSIGQSGLISKTSAHAGGFAFTLVR